MTMDHQTNRHLGGGLSFDHMPYGSSPHFTNPWGSSSPNPHMYPQTLNTNNMGFDAIAKQAQKNTTSSLPYSSIPAPSPMASTGYSAPPYDSSHLVNMSQELLNQQGYSGAQSSVNSYAPTSVPYSSPFGGVAPVGSEPRRISHSSVASSQAPSYNDALDASRSMVAMSTQDLTTPRGLYDTRSDRGSTDGYGFPATHSPHSSVSGGSSYAGSYPSYAASVDSSVSDYGSQSDLESVNARPLVRTGGLIGANGLPPPQSMMGQFNSKVSSSAQKKHKCKICDKRFTRPSSLQTHMYSHTGEKPYACDAEGCGRTFSVVSNLRRHRKVHKTDRTVDHESPENHWAEK